LNKAKLILDNNCADLIFGDDLLISEKDIVLQVTNGHASCLKKMMLFAGWTPLQESCFWKSELYEKVGGIDPTIKYAADYDLFLRMSLIGKCAYIPVIFGAFRRHHDQISLLKIDSYKKERGDSRKKQLDELKPNIFISFIKVYYWFKIRWRVRLRARKKQMNHLVGRNVLDVGCQESN
jgi:hypothetical protein